ncbi:hypothetical protein OpiT1DRAFT_03663 [Opitutaceae bacterium TAV1]|nr:hypothetical protein OpiT1DRAFT_03663 [Opitutaceae bacterium TAV1]
MSCMNYTKPPGGGEQVTADGEGETKHEKNLPVAVCATCLPPARGKGE